MNDNLPDINFKEKKEKKRGALGWLRSRLGLGSRGAVGEAGINPSVMNVGRATFGAGSKAGIAGLLAGKAGMIAAIAAVAVASGVYLSNQAPAPSSSSAFNSGGGKVQDNYVPAILRSQAANQGSSLDMFKDTNKNSGLSLEEDPSKKAAKAAAENPEPSKDGAAAEGQDQTQPAPDQGNMAQAMMGKLQGGEMGGSLTSSLGGGSNKFSSMGGFGNKFNQGQMGAKTGFSNNVGSGFQAMPKFDARKSKMTAMKGSARPVFTSGKAGKKGNFGTGAFGQAKGMKKVQQGYKGNSADMLAGTQNAAWNGSTPDGSTTGGTGVSDGGAGIMSSPSLDTAGGSSGGGGGGTPEEPTVPEASAPTDVSPWANAVSMAMMMIMLSCMLTVLGAYLISIAKAGSVIVGAGGWLYTIGMALCLIAALMAAYAIYQAITIMTQHGQALLGTVYLVGGAAAAAAAVTAMVTGTPGQAISSTVLILAAAGGIISMIGSMLGGK